MDEAVAIALLQLFGRNAFPGVENAEIVFRTTEVSNPRSDTLYIGIGHGDFDEHRPMGRLPNTCAAMLVAKHLRLEHRPDLKPLLEKTLWADTQPKVFSSELANLVKTVHRVKGGKDQIGTYNWVRQAILAIIFGQPTDPNYDLRQSWANYCEDQGLNKEEYQAITSMISMSYGRRNSMITELASICKVMNPAMRQTWLPATFGMLVQDAALYKAALNMVDANDAAMDEFDTGKGMEPMFAIETDNECINRACASKKVGAIKLTIIRNTTGHTQLFLNPELGLDISPLAQMLRMAEYLKRTGNTLDPFRALGNGTLGCAPQWHLPNANTILNGSLTHPSVNPSKLTLAEVKEVAQSAFNSELRKKWLEDYSRTPASSKSLEELKEVLEG